MKTTAVAPANIAFIKYWGKKDPALRLPLNPSISMNLSACTTTTTVEFSKDFNEDSVSEGFDKQRIIEHVDRLRSIVKSEARVRVTTENNFPKSAGVASSASGFAALTVAAAAALDLKLSENELSALARMGSGSACRSIPDGFVKWEGEYAWSLYPSDYWDLRDIIVIVDNSNKKVSSSEGHDKAITSPYFKKRLQALPKRIKKIEEAFRKRDFRAFGEIIEEECLDMHRVMQTQEPPLYYWNEETKKIMQIIQERRVPAYFTIDAGPNVHVICEGKNEEKVTEYFKKYSLIVNKPERGAHII